MSEVFQLSLDDLLVLEADWRIGGIADPVGQIASYIISTLETAFNYAVSGFQTVVSSIVNTAIGAVNSLLNGISRNVSSILLTLQSLPNTISSSLSGITSQVSSILNGVVGSISSTITQISYSVSSGFNSILSSLNSAFSSLSNSVNASIRSISGSISGTLNSIVSSISSIVSQIGGSLSSIGQQILSGLGSAFSQLSSSFNGIVGQINTFLQPLISQLQTALPNIEKIIVFLAAFGANPIVAIQNGLNTVLKAFGLPTLDDIRHELEGALSEAIPALKPVLDTLSKVNDAVNNLPKTLVDTVTSKDFLNTLTNTVTNTVKEVVVLPEEIKTFFNSATKVLDKLVEQHSPSILDDFGSALTNIIEAFSATGIFGSLLQSEAWKSFLSGKGFASTITTDTNFFKPLTDYLNTIWKTIQQDAKPFTDAISSAFGILVSTAISDFGLPKPAAGITDPFEMIGSTITQEFNNLAAMVTPKSPIVEADVIKTTETILAVVGVTEALEFGAMAIEALHPTKKLQFMDKLKRSFSKIGVGHVTEIVGASLVAVSLSPFFRRYFNRVAQVQLPDVGTLTTMLHRKKIAASDFDSYLQEHGLNKTFRDAYSEIAYSLPSIRILRSIWMTGKIDESGIEEIFSLGGMLPKYAPIAANAVVLQGLLPYLKAQETAFASQVAKGFETGVTFSDMLKKINYPSSFITPTVAAAELKADETLNVLQVSEYDKQYTEGYMNRDDYVKNITPLFKNQAILGAHIEIADLAVKRMTDSRIRTASDRSIAEGLAEFANGAISPKEFETICKAGKKTPEEIAALESARQVIYANLVRTVKFRNYQGALGKGNITPAQFEALSKALPIDNTIMKATEQHIILGMVKAAKITTAAANALLAQAGIPLVTA